MGDPATTIAADRAETRELARRIVESVRDDASMAEAMGFSRHVGRYEQSNIEPLLFDLAQENDLLQAERDESRKALNAAHRKVGEARKIIDEFWARKGAHDPYDRDTSWAMHVAMVQLAELLKRGGTNAT